MSKKTDAFYFQNLISVSAICVDAANYLVDCLTDYHPEKIEECLEKMHTFEHSADLKKHEMAESLSHAFITPLEREDLAELSNNLDEVADTIEEVLQRFYMDAPASVTEECILMAKNVAASCLALKKMFSELQNFKKPQQLLADIIEVSDIEEASDRLYLKAYRDIRNKNLDALDVMAWRKIYDYLERCTDACEHVADIVGVIVMKNS